MVFKIWEEHIVGISYWQISYIFGVVLNLPVNRRILEHFSVEILVNERTYSIYIFLPILI